MLKEGLPHDLPMWALLASARGAGASVFTQDSSVGLTSLGWVLTFLKDWLMFTAPSELRPRPHQGAVTRWEDDDVRASERRAPRGRGSPQALPVAWRSGLGHGDPAARHVTVQVTDSHIAVEGYVDGSLIDGVVVGEMIPPIKTIGPWETIGWPKTFFHSTSPRRRRLRGFYL